VAAPAAPEAGEETLVDVEETGLQSADLLPADFPEAELNDEEFASLMDQISRRGAGARS
jgi:hypothetical protein